MLPRDYIDWLSGVPHSWFAMVSQFVVVFSAHIQLFFLRWKLGGLFWCGDKSRGILTLFGCLPSIFIVCTVLRWLRLVCVVTGEKVLHEAIQSVRMDPCGTAHCRHTELSNHSEYFRRYTHTHTQFQLHLQLHCCPSQQVWFGSLYLYRWLFAMMWWPICLVFSSAERRWLSSARRRRGKASLVVASQRLYLVWYSPIFYANTNSSSVPSNTMKRLAVCWNANQAIYSDHNNTLCHLYVFILVIFSYAIHQEHICPHILTAENGAINYHLSISVAFAIHERV